MYPFHARRYIPWRCGKRYSPYPEAMEPWYERAKARMTELGVTQDDLKKPLEVETRGAVGHYLNGRRDPSPHQLAALAKTLRVSLDELLTGKLSPGVAEPHPQQPTDEELLARCMRAVDTILDDLKYPKKHKIRNPENKSELVVHAYRIAKDEGRFDERELREKIRLAAKVA